MVAQELIPIGITHPRPATTEDIPSETTDIVTEEQVRLATDQLTEIIITELSATTVPAEIRATTPITATQTQTATIHIIILLATIPAILVTQAVTIPGDRAAADHLVAEVSVAAEAVVEVVAEEVADNI